MADHPVKIPGEPIDPAGSDVLSPLQDLLGGVNVLGGSQDSGSAFSKPSQSVAILESGATALTKWWSGAVGAVGGLTAIAAVATRFWNSQTGDARVALLAATGAVLAAAVLALAIIISADVRSRANGATAVYAARAHITGKFIEATMSAAMGHPSAQDGGAAAIVPDAEAQGADPSAPDLGAEAAKATQAATAAEAQAMQAAKSAAAAQAAVEPLGDQLTEIGQQLSGMDKRTALVALAAARQIAFDSATPIPINSTASGVTGSLKSIFMRTNTDTQAPEVQLKVVDETGTVNAVDLDDVKDFG
jgi:trimeric autotransporter adhesin